jgi:CheY-like chemotaxis protein
MELLKEFMRLISSNESQEIRIPPYRILNTVEKIIRGTFPPSIEVIAEYSKELSTIDGDPPQLCQILLDLCLQAKKRLAHGGRLRLATFGCMTADEATPGIAFLVQASEFPAGAPRCWPSGEACTDDAVIDEIVASHRGLISRHCGEGEDWRVTITLPVAEQAAQPERREEGAGRDSSLSSQACTKPLDSPGLLLLIDDDESVRAVTAAVLRGAGYDVLVASDGAEGLSLFRQHREKIRLALTDLAMRYQDGPYTIERLRELAPNLQIVALTGLTGDHKELDLEKLKINGLLRKPFTTQDLLALLARSIGHP